MEMPSACLCNQSMGWVGLARYWARTGLVDTSRRGRSTGTRCSELSDVYGLDLIDWKRFFVLVGGEESREAFIVEKGLVACRTE